MAEHTYTVTELNREIKDLLEMQFGSIWLEGELSNFKHHSSGHMYFSLKDAESEIRSVMWRGLNQSLRFRPEDGMQVLVQGDISVYTPRGQYQIIVNRMQPAGAGALQIAFEQLKEHLRKEGLFDESRKRPLPPYPTTMGVVTSGTGAAFRDILHVLKRRAPYIRVILASARVQGDGAAEEIVRGIEWLNRLDGVEVIVIGRGGGSIEDLWPFNEEIVARAVVASEKPVISAVGHEVDFSISDFCADYRAPTPSAAAEILARDSTELTMDLEGIYHQLQEKLWLRIDRLRSRLDALVTHYAFKMPLQNLATYNQQIDEVYTSLGKIIHLQLNERSQIMEHLEKELNLLHPERILRRGFSITRDAAGRVIKSANALEQDQIITTQLHQGVVISEIREIGEEKNE